MKKLGLLILLMASIAVMLMLSVGIAMADVNTTTQGGQEPAEGWDNVKGHPEEGGLIIRDHIKKFHQGKFKPFATDLHLKVWQKEDNIEVRGWQIKITGFPNSNSQRGNQPSPWHNRVDNMPGLPSTKDPDNGQHAIDVTADGANIPYCTIIEVEIIWWLTSRNTKHIKVNWTKDANETKAITSNGWTIDNPVPDPLNPGQYLHRFVLDNDDTTDYLNVSGLTFNASMDWYDNLTNVSFPPPYPNISLAPGESWQTNINTNGPFYKGHIYFKYAIKDATTGNVAAVELGDHPTPVPEFTTIAIPVAAILGLLFLFSRRRRKE